MYWLILFLFLLPILLLGIFLYFRYFHHQTFEFERPKANPGKSVTIYIDGLKFHYRVLGQGPPILLLHGLGASSYSWRFLMPLLAKSNKVFALDLIGFGKSDLCPERKYDLDAQTKRVRQFVNELKIDPLLVIASSMGATIALHWASQFPSEVKSQCLIGPALFPLKVPKVPKVVRQQIARLGHVLVNRQIVQIAIKRTITDHRIIDQDMLENYSEPFLKQDSSVFSFLESLECLTDLRTEGQRNNIATKTLIIVGLNDRQIKAKWFKSFKENELVKIEKHDLAGHHLMEDDPYWLFERIGKYLLLVH